jgi:hypothetical protein
MVPAITAGDEDPKSVENTVLSPVVFVLLRAKVI